MDPRSEEGDLIGMSRYCDHLEKRIAELEAEIERWKHHAINQYARRTGAPLDDQDGRDVIEQLLSQ